MWDADKPRSCLIGKNNELELWREENGKKRNEEELNDMDCFKETESSKKYNNMMILLDKLDDIIKK